MERKEAEHIIDLIENGEDYNKFLYGKRPRFIRALKQNKDLNARFSQVVVKRIKEND